VVLTGLLAAKLLLFGVQYASMRVLISRRIANG
jgi:hypothetical protein